MNKNDDSLQAYEKFMQDSNNSEEAKAYVKEISSKYHGMECEVKNQKKEIKELQEVLHIIKVICEDYSNGECKVVFDALYDIVGSYVS